MKTVLDRLCDWLETLLFPPRRPGLVPIPVESRRRRSIAPLIAAVALCGFAADGAFAQGRIRDFTEPVLVHGSEGHHAPVQALVFPKPDGSVLLSAGLDKVVHQWDLDGVALTPTRTLRPPIWRGRRGEIRAMAISPKPDAQGQRLLATGGLGIAYNSADIVLFRYPGLDVAAQATGDLLAHLPSATIQAPDAGHRDAVLRLAFNSDGSRLASSSLDGTVRVWDPATRVSTATLSGHAGRVAGLAWLSDNLIATGDSAGDVRVFELTPAVREVTRVRISLQDPPAEGVEGIVKLLATADGKTLVAADARGRVTKFDAPTLANPVRFAPKANQGGVLDLAISADGTRFAAAHERLQPPAGPRDWRNRESDVEVRSLLDGSAILPTITTDEYVTAVGFSPDNRRFLYAGGASQGIHVRSINPVDPAETPVVLQGHGTTVRDIGFAANGLGIALSRERLDGPRPAPPILDGFDFEQLQPRPYPAEGIRRAETALGGWSVEPVSTTRLDVVHQNGFRTSITLNEATDGVWWSYTFLAPRNAGEHPMLAVGCSAGTALYVISPETRRTRFLAGHEGEVLTLAASADGKWLASGSNDQTVRLWTLADAEKVPPFGAVLMRRDDGTHVFDSIARAGFADAMGIGPGDRLLEALIDGKPVGPEEFIARADAAIPGPERNISVRILKPGDGPEAARTVGLMTSKRQAPALSLFLADRPAGEWVAWNPIGIYDTSIAGDGKYLGWHQNQSADINQPRPTLHYKIARFQDRFRNPAAIRVLLATGDENRLADEAVRLALIDPALIVIANRPPTLGAIASNVGADLARVRVKASALGGKLLRSLAVTDASRPVRTVPIPAGSTTFDSDLDIPIAPGAHRIGIAATDADGKTETTWVDVKSAAPAKRVPRLIVTTMGAERFGSAALESVAHAESDARDLAAFLGDRLLTPGEEKPFAADRVERRTLIGETATAAGLEAELARLKGLAAKGELGPGDQVVLAIESRALTDSANAWIAGGDLVEPAPPRPALDAAKLAASLGELTRGGVRVLLFLDVVHKDHNAEEGRVLSGWIKDLRDKHGVVTLTASGPRVASEPRVVDGRLNFPTLRHRLHAQALLDTVTASGGRKVRVRPNGGMSLDGFQLTVNEAVKSRTRGRQLTGAYLPDAVAPTSTFLNVGAKPR